MADSELYSAEDLEKLEEEMKKEEKEEEKEEGKKEDITFKAFMPVTKTQDGRLVGILSDTSIDRDDEFMTKELLQNCAKENSGLKALADNKNSMSAWVGGWTNLHTIEKKGYSALVC